jgi:hypothetical protein
MCKYIEQDSQLHQKVHTGSPKTGYDWESNEGIYSRMYMINKRPYYKYDKRIEELG